jgi:hypothetical protein
VVPAPNSCRRMSFSRDPRRLIHISLVFLLERNI